MENHTWVTCKKGINKEEYAKTKTSKGFVTDRIFGENRGGSESTQMCVRSSTISGQWGYGGKDSIEQE